MKFFKFFIINILCTKTFLLSNEGVCHRCELIREENAKQTNPYPYYEDYLKAQENSDSSGTLEQDD